MLRVRESFAAKILAGIVCAVALLSVVTYGVVRVETDRQVEGASERAVRNAESQFRGLEAFQQREVDRVARLLAEGRRTLAELDEAIEASDRTYLAGHVAYELDLADISDMVVAFTDARGRGVLTLHNAVILDESDPLGVGPVAVSLLAGEGFEVRSYRVLDRVLFGIGTRVIELAGRPIGTISFGLPVTDEEISRIGSAVGVEVCVAVAGACVAGTNRGRGALAAALEGVVGSDEVEMVQADGEPWSVKARPLIEGRPEQGSRVVAVPLRPVLAPFNRIRRALLLGGGAALALALFVSGLLSRGLTRPVRALVAATGRVAEGDFDTTVQVRSRDEVGRLAEAFNQMTHGLLLKEQYRSVLDKVVSPDVAEQLLEGGVELGGENRQVTVLFADIRGFTALTDGMEPQAVIGFLNECMQRLSDAVDAEGGVVDKYVGDELMAVFGAPVSAGEDASRALRAALRMRGAITELNAERARRSEAPLGLGVGVNTGLAVAGNMGSKNRLNYTVLGDTVNMASRLCSAAEAGEILITAASRRAGGEGVRCVSRGGRSLKGFTADVEVFDLLGMREQEDEGRDREAVGERQAGGGGEAPRGRAQGNERGGARRSTKLSALLVFLAAVAAPGAVMAQGGQLPTLRDAGLEYVSGSGNVQIAFSGQLDLETFRFSDHRAGLAWVGGGGSNLFAHRLRLFTDVFVGERVYGLVELRSDRGPSPNDGDLAARVEQAYLRLSSRSGALSLQVGRFASPFGSYGQRHLSEADPFVRPPLPYDFRTVQSSTTAPPNASRFLEWQWDPDTFRHSGAPPVWSVPYQWGAMVSGAAGVFSYRLAAMNSAPSSEPEAWGFSLDRFKRPSWVAGVGAAVTQELQVGISFNRGPWLEKPAPDAWYAAYRWRDYVQEMVSADATFVRGPFMIRGEVIHDRWEVPGVADDPVDIGYVLEAQADVAAGVFVAARYGALDFSFVDDGRGPSSSRTGGGAAWDHDIARYEGSLGYRLVRNAGLMVSWFRQAQAGATDSDGDLLAARFWWAF